MGLFVGLLCFIDEEGIGEGLFDACLSTRVFWGLLLPLFSTVGGASELLEDLDDVAGNDGFNIDYRRKNERGGERGEEIKEEKQIIIQTNQ